MSSPPEFLHNDRTSLEDEAIDWLVLLESGRATDKDRDAFILWQQQSESHAIAAHKAQQLWQALTETETAKTYKEKQNSVRNTQKRIRWQYRQLSTIAAVVAIMVTIGFMALGPYSLRSFLADHATKTGYRNTVMLSDGSLAMLNTASAFSKSMKSDLRAITLHGGEVMFDVAKDHTRPFVVYIDNNEVRAVGTIFSVQHYKEQIQVTVSEGIVEVRPENRTGRQALKPIMLHAGQKISWDSTTNNLVAEYSDINRDLAWTRGKLIFNRRPLDQVVQQLDLYYPGWIVLRSKELRTLEVTGVFDLQHPEELVSMIEKTLPINVIRIPYLTVIY